MNQVWKPIVLKLETDEEVLKQKTDALEKQLNIIESYFLGEKPFLTGDTITIADIMCCMELNSVDYLICSLADNHQKLVAYLSRVAEKLQPHYDKYNKAITEFAREKLGKKK